MVHYCSNPSWAHLARIFGCADAKDEFSHYLVCPILWQFAREFIIAEEPSLSIESRLCLVEPNIDKLRALAFVYSLYHACKNDPGCSSDDGSLLRPDIVQIRASELARAVRHLVHL